MLTPLPVPPAHHLVVAKPSRSAETGKIYRAFDETSTKSAHSVEPVVSALRYNSVLALAAAVGNDLAPVTKDFVPEVGTLKQAMLSAGALGSSMSGSGTAVYGIFDDEDASESAKDTVDAPFAGVYEPVPYGVEIV